MGESTPRTVLHAFQEAVEVQSRFDLLEMKNDDMLRLDVLKKELYQARDDYVQHLYNRSVVVADELELVRGYDPQEQPKDLLQYHKNMMGALQEKRAQLLELFERAEQEDTALDETGITPEQMEEQRYRLEGCDLVMSLLMQMLTAATFIPSRRLYPVDEYTLYMSGLDTQKL